MQHQNRASAVAARHGSNQEIFAFAVLFAPADGAKEIHALFGEILEAVQQFQRMAVRPDAGIEIAFANLDRRAARAAVGPPIADFENLAGSINDNGADADLLDDFRQLEVQHFGQTLDQVAIDTSAQSRAIRINARIFT
ncbi:hypothetical protein [Rhodopseudomonas faecalis]|uniref:hypothetical protein n=1 Tax=Rhodopseudomonas faecalis TaxID=99655 RepID=UPI001FE108B4|nr:hypothetical protein [Rhodopseudomonas faecalis]